MSEVMEAINMYNNGEGPKMHSRSSENKKSKSSRNNKAKPQPR